MKTIDELKRAFEVYLVEMQRCEEAKTYWALLHMLLALPDICAALEEPGAGQAERYVRWCKAHFDDNPILTPGDRYQIRNAVLHEGSTLPTNRSTVAAKRTQYSSFSFVEPGATRGSIHQNVSPGGENLTLDVRQLAIETRNAMERWFASLQHDPGRNARVEENLPRLARFQTKVSQVPIETAEGSKIETADGSLISIETRHKATSST